MAQLNIVEGVQEVAPELEVFAFRYMEVLQPADVCVCESRPPHGSLGWAVAERPGRRLGEAALTHPLIALEVASEALLAAVDNLLTAVGTSAARTGPRRVGGIRNRQREAAVDRDDRRGLPVPQHCVQYRVHV